MLREVLNNSGILAFIGIFVVLLLSEPSTIYKKHKEQKDGTSFILDEVRFNHEQTKNKIDILRQAICPLFSFRTLPM